MNQLYLIVPFVFIIIGAYFLYLELQKTHGMVKIMQQQQKETIKHNQILNLGMRQLIHDRYGNDVDEKSEMDVEKEPVVKEILKSDGSRPVRPPRNKNLAQAALSVLNEEDEIDCKDKNAHVNASARDVQSGATLYGYESDISGHDDVATTVPEDPNSISIVRNERPIQSTGGARGIISDVLEDNGNVSMYDGQHNVAEDQDQMFDGDSETSHNSDLDEIYDEYSNPNRWIDHEKNLQISKTEHCPYHLTRGRRAGHQCGRKTIGVTGFCKNHQSRDALVHVQMNENPEQIRSYRPGMVKQQGVIDIDTPEHNLNLGISHNTFRENEMLSTRVVAPDQMGQNAAFFNREREQLDSEAEDIINSIGA